MNYDKDCLFCKFVNEGMKDNQCLYEDDLTYVMLDDFPISRGHSLVIFREHILDFLSLKEKQAEHLGRVSALISKALRETLKSDKIYVASLGEEVEHLHLHLIPRYEDDRKGFAHFIGKRGELRDYENMVASIRNYLKR